MWVSKAKQKKKKKKGGYNQENSRFFISSNHRRARLQAPLCKRLRLGVSVLLKKKKKVTYGKLSVQARGGRTIRAERLFSCHTASVWVRGFKPQVNRFPLKESRRGKKNNVPEPSGTVCPTRHLRGGGCDT